MDSKRLSPLDWSTIVDQNQKIVFRVLPKRPEAFLLVGGGLLIYHLILFSTSTDQSILKFCIYVAIPLLLILFGIFGMNMKIIVESNEISLLFIGAKSVNKKIPINEIEKIVYNKKTSKYEVFLKQGGKAFFPYHNKGRQRDEIENLFKSLKVPFFGEVKSS